MIIFHEIASLATPMVARLALPLPDRSNNESWILNRHIIYSQSSRTFLFFSLLVFLHYFYYDSKITDDLLPPYCRAYITNSGRVFTTCNTGGNATITGVGFPPRTITLDILTIMSICTYEKAEDRDIHLALIDIKKHTTEYPGCNYGRQSRIW